MTPHGLGYYDNALGAYLPDDPKFVCERCEQLVDTEDELHEVEFDKLVCDDCFSEYHECDCCKTLYHTDDMNEVQGKEYCEDCYHEYVRVCGLCNEEYFNEDEDIHICDKCAKEIV